MLKGFFVTFEGGEGSGKTTQIARLAERLRARGEGVFTAREPGGSPGADALRHVLLSGAAEPLGPEVETMLFAAARADHVTQAIWPALAAGKVVLCDRFVDSTRVYQGLGSRVDPLLVTALERAALRGLYPDLTVILDIDARTGLARAARRRGGGDADRFEREDEARHEARRQAFLQIAREEPERCVVIDGTNPEDDIAELIAFAVEDRLEARRAECADTPPEITGAIGQP